MARRTCFLLAPYFIPTVYSTALVRSMSHLASTNRDDLAWLYSRVVCHLVVAALPLALCGLVGLARPPSDLYGEPYGDADTTLALLLLERCLHVSSMDRLDDRLCGRGRTPDRGDRRCLIHAQCHANLFAIPAWGIEGAAAVNVATEALTVALLLFVLRVGREARLVRSCEQAADGGRACGLDRVRVGWRATCGSADAGGAVYVAALLLLRTFDAHDDDFLRSRAAQVWAQVDVGANEGVPDTFMPSHPRADRDREVRIRYRQLGFLELFRRQPHHEGHRADEVSVADDLAPPAQAGTSQKCVESRRRKAPSVLLT